MLYCQSSPDDHRAAAVYALSFSRECGHRYPVRTLACLQHGAELRARPRSSEATACERCGARSPLVLKRVEDVFEERVTLSILRATLEQSVHTPVTFAYDRALRIVADRGREPIATYRTPVRWRAASAPGGPGGLDLVEATVSLAVTVPAGAGAPVVGKAG